jgi:putative PIN family toxin of toxin-antitoxin system
VIRAVIDTNVLVSGLLSPNGNEALVILAIHHSWLCPCISEEIVDEYAAVLRRPKFSFPVDEVGAVLSLFRGRGETFAPGSFAASSPDPADTKFLHCALAARADFIVTGNRRDFPAGRYGMTNVVSAAELLDLITRQAHVPPPRHSD